MFGVSCLVVELALGAFLAGCVRFGISLLDPFSMGERPNISVKGLWKTSRRSKFTLEQMDEVRTREARILSVSDPAQPGPIVRKVPLLARICPISRVKSLRDSGISMARVQ